MIDFVSSNREEGDKINITKLWEFIALHEKIVREDERKIIKSLFAETISSGAVKFLIEIDKK